MSIVIHKTDVSPPARATLMLVDILGLKVQTREVNLPTRDQFKPEYLEKNPLHSVPLLEDDGLVLADSHAIMMYLVSKYGEAQRTLYPNDVAARAIVHQRLFFDASILFPRLKGAIYSLVKFRAAGLTDEQVADIIECYDVTEKYLVKEYIAGNKLTLADISCVATLSSLDCIIPIDNKYVKVYLLNSKYSSNQPEAWLCGGVIISRIHILTAAACLTEVSHIYVIAGYKKYVSGENIDNDECTRTKKKRIVKVIIPKAFNGSTWMQYDVGLGVVDSRYNFSDVSYRKICSYEPSSIKINFDLNKERTRSFALALGWGAADASRPGMVADTNSEYLMQARTIITNITYCREQFSKDIEYLFLCTDDTRNIDVVQTGKAVMRSGNMETERTTTTTTKSPIKQDQYFKEMWRCLGKNFSSNATSNECLDMDSAESSLRRRVLSSNGTALDEINNKNKTFDGNGLNINETISRKQRQNFGTLGKNFGKKQIKLGGICQNDHGGPLILPMGNTQIVIGVALNSVYDKKYQCKGPFLYLSTARAGKLMKCLLSKKLRSTNRKLCSNNYEVTEYDVSWPTGNQPVPKQEPCKNRFLIKDRQANGSKEKKLTDNNNKYHVNSSRIRTIPEVPAPLPSIESEEQIQPTFTQRLQYKRPNLNMNTGLFKRPTLNIGW